jgi:hypothetical protein
MAGDSTDIHYTRSGTNRITLAVFRQRPQNLSAELQRSLLKQAWPEHFSRAWAMHDKYDATEMWGGFISAVPHASCAATPGE